MNVLLVTLLPLLLLLLLLFKDIYVVVANKLKNDTIVDDFITGDDSKEALVRLKIIAARSV
jgi:hypothetical protein